MANARALDRRRRRARPGENPKQVSWSSRDDIGAAYGPSVWLPRSACLLSHRRSRYGAPGMLRYLRPKALLSNNMGRDDLAEFATIFVFEVYLEKRFYEETIIGTNIVDAVGSPVTPGSTQAAMKDLLSPSDANKPSDVPIPNPTTHDVLFGRGYVPFLVAVVAFVGWW